MDNPYPICENCVFADEPLDKDPCQECNRAFLAQRIKPNFVSKRKLKTNADRLRAKTDTERVRLVETGGKRVRLTYWNDRKGHFDWHCENNEIADKLAAYEDEEAEGLLVCLPCKVGDVLFVTDEGTILPAVRMVESVTWCNGKISIQAVNNRTGIDYYCSAEDFGNTVFLQREEAEAALKGEQNR